MHRHSILIEDRILTANVSADGNGLGFVDISTLMPPFVVVAVATSVGTDPTTLVLNAGVFSGFNEPDAPLSSIIPAALELVDISQIQTAGAGVPIIVWTGTELLKQIPLAVRVLTTVTAAAYGSLGVRFRVVIVGNRSPNGL